MRREGNRNFGVWQPPSGVDAVRRSSQVNLESIVRLNNPRQTRELGIAQSLMDPNQGSVERSNQAGIDLISRINNISRRGDFPLPPGSSPSPSSPPSPPGSSPSPSSPPSPPPSPSSAGLPPGNLTAAEIDTAMQARTCLNPSITVVYFFADDGGRDEEGNIIPPSFRRREGLRWGSLLGKTGPLYEEQGWIGETDTSAGQLGWLSSDDIMAGSLAYLMVNSGDAFITGFEISPSVRAECFSPSPSPSPSFGGNASPPPPPNRKSMCCDCNTIATIVEDKIIRQNEAIKDHIDKRTREELQVINKMLQGMNIKLDLQPVIDRLNQVEANLWNGAGS